MSRRRTSPLAGEHVLITGGSSGIGLAFAKSLVERNANVTLVARDAAKLAPFRKEIEALGRRTCGVDLDVRDHASIKAAVASVEQQMGRLAAAFRAK